ncbi:MAG: cob(I)yrinic acid a,c-diamide adenosyltransferase [Rhodoblastus sp.]|nr:cob(I)yrinic acid a,c-diamide adenosyltransferase [Rhodoblastus sp.]
MVRLNKIYTRTGDDGTTALVSGERRSKADLRVEAYGAIDEANAAIGMARAALGGNEPGLVRMLARIQNDLFDLGADLATPASTPRAEGALRIVKSQVDRLEREIDEMNAELQPLKSFILPGGSLAAATLHMARTIARRAERIMVALAGTPGEAIDAPAMQYINRLSDLLFVASRVANQRGAADILWTPGQNR